MPTSGLGTNGDQTLECQGASESFLWKGKGETMLTPSSPGLGRTTLLSHLRVLPLLLQGGSFPHSKKRIPSQ